MSNPIDPETGLPRVPDSNVAILHPAGRVGGVPAPIAKPWRPQDADTKPAGPSPELELFAALLKYRWMMSAIIGACLLAGMIFTLGARPLYTAKTTLQLDRQTEKIMGHDDTTPIDNYGDEFFQTQYGLMKSPALAASSAPIARRPTTRARRWRCSAIRTSSP